MSQTSDGFTVNKTRLKNVINDKVLLNNIKNTVITVNKIVILSSQLIHTYLCSLYITNEKFPLINEGFIRSAFNLCYIKNSNRGRREIDNEDKNSLAYFFDECFKTYCIKNSDLVKATHIVQCLLYEQQKLEIEILSNIRFHFIDYVNKYVNAYCDRKGNMYKINTSKKSNNEKYNERKQFDKNLRDIKWDMLSLDDKFKSDEIYHDWIRETRKNIIPNIPEKGNVMYDVKKNPLNYLQSMYYINDQIEKINKERNEKNKHNKCEVSLFQIIPQRKNIVPKHITIDTALIKRLGGKKYSLEKGEKLTKENKNKIWEKGFKIHKRIFGRKKYEFNHIIQTDGVSISIILKRKEKFKNEFTIRKYKKIEDISKKCLIKENYVVIDPGMCDLIYCAKENKDDLITFRYTAKQRLHETKHYKYKKIHEYLEKDIKEIIEKYSFNSKSVDIETAIDYCTEKNNMNRKLFKHYEKEIFRKLKFNSYVNRQKSESKMINNFRKTFGNPNEIKIVYGDWSAYDNNNNNKIRKESSSSKDMKKIFERKGYEIYLINEYNTSALCNKCKHKCENFHQRDGEKFLVWGLKRCTHRNCQTIHNRNKNACKNMLSIIEYLRKGLGRKEFEPKQ